MKKKTGYNKVTTCLLMGLTVGNIVNISAQQEEIPNKKHNVLFIAVDDLRPSLGCYGQQHIHSPNIDRLAESGLTFTRAYCNVPVCGASRASLLSGLRPNRDRFVNFSCRQDEDVPGIVSLPMHFRNNGYYTMSLGKIYHHSNDGKGSWSENPWSPRTDVAYILPESLEQLIPHANSPGSFRGPAFEAPDAPDHVYRDGMLANEAVTRMRELKNSGQPFFLAVGFWKPHLPFNAPKKYWDLYDFDKIELPDNMNKPKDAPDAAMHNFGELRNYSDVPRQGPLDEVYMRKLIHGYYASVSYVDAQIGKVLDELENLGLEENTIVILWGDHGYFLAEHGLWCKHSNLEKAAHTPMILRAPGKTVKNSRTSALVEFVDIYPTLSELAGLQKPFHLQGESFVPLAEDPDQPWKEEIYYRWIRGETVVTQTHTFTRWFSDGTGEVTGQMLFNIKNDPEETVNIAEKPEVKNLVRELSDKLSKHIEERDMLTIPSGN